VCVCVCYSACVVHHRALWQGRLLRTAAGMLHSILQMQPLFPFKVLSHRDLKNTFVCVLASQGLAGEAAQNGSGDGDNFGGYAPAAAPAMTPRSVCVGCVFMHA
jgi:hypothetical protein